MMFWLSWILLALALVAHHFVQRNHLRRHCEWFVEAWHGKDVRDLTRKYNLLQELVMRYRVEATRGKAKSPLNDAEVPLEWRVGALESRMLLQGMMQESHERLEPAVCKKCGLPVVMEELFAFEYDGGVLAVCEACLQVLKDRKGDSDAETQS
jgi:hypothetical protein